MLLELLTGIMFYYSYDLGFISLLFLSFYYKNVYLFALLTSLMMTGFLSLLCIGCMVFLCGFYANYELIKNSYVTFRESVKSAKKFDTTTNTSQDSNSSTLIYLDNKFVWCENKYSILNNKYNIAVESINNFFYVSHDNLFYSDIKKIIGECENLSFLCVKKLIDNLYIFMELYPFNKIVLYFSNFKTKYEKFVELQKDKNNQVLNLSKELETNMKQLEEINKLMSNTSILNSNNNSAYGMLDMMTKKNFEQDFMKKMMTGINPEMKQQLNNFGEDFIRQMMVGGNPFDKLSKSPLKKNKLNNKKG